MARVRTVFDCRHEVDIDVEVDDEVEIPSQVRGLGKCAACLGQDNLVPVSGVAPQPGGKRVVLDSIMLMPV